MWNTAAGSRLNPFYFRAAAEQNPALLAVVSARSQSLLLQGCCCTAQNGCAILHPIVSIPFTSGLLLNGYGLLRIFAGRVSIPFTSGLLLNPHGINGGIMTRCLNPFYFRAAAERLRAWGLPETLCLNPFYFRAAAERGGANWNDWWQGVSIPFTSGLLLNMQIGRFERTETVSIPFTSGLLLNTASGWTSGWTRRLNPFYFRAAAEHADWTV